jgi:uncharacterized membrane protein
MAPAGMSNHILDLEVSMKKLSGFVRTTVLGGVFYLVPIIVLVAVVGKAHGISRKLVAPLAALFPLDGPLSFLSEKVLAIIVIVLFCFVAGLIAKTARGKGFTRWLESNVLALVPGYALVKSMSDSMAGVEEQSGREAVLARIEDAWQIALVVERLDNGHVAVYVPGAPNAASGSVYFMTEDRIKPLGIPVSTAVKCVRRVGVGANALLRDKM